jgi:hypothetical protein
MMQLLVLMTLTLDILLVAVETVECALEVAVVTSHGVVSLGHNVACSEADQTGVTRTVQGLRLSDLEFPRVGGTGKKHL